MKCPYPEIIGQPMKYKAARQAPRHLAFHPPPRQSSLARMILYFQTPFPYIYNIRGDMPVPIQRAVYILVLPLSMILNCLVEKPYMKHFRYKGQRKNQYNLKRRRPWPP